MASQDVTPQDMVQNAQSEIGRLQTHAVHASPRSVAEWECSRDLS